TLVTGHQPEQAEAVWQRAMTLSERWTAKEPNHAGHLRIQIRCLTTTADVLRKKDPARVEAMLLRAQTLATRFQALDTKSVTDVAARTVSDVDGALGALYLDQGRHKEAEAAYRRQVATMEKYAADFPGIRVYQGWLSWALDGYGWFLLADHRPAEAEPIFRRAW